MRAVSLFLILAASISAQSPGDPLTLIRIVRKHVSPRNPISLYTNAKPALQVMGLKSITGNSQAWLLEAHGTFGSLEDADRALAAVTSSGDLQDELLAPDVVHVCLYRHSLSYRPDEAVKLMPSARYLQVSIYRSRPGYDIDFAELMRSRKAALDRRNVDRPEIGYQVISGALAGTYYFIAPLPSLKTLDESVIRWLRDDYVPTSGGRAGQQIAAEGDITREHLLFRVEPRWSWAPEDRSR